MQTKKTLHFSLRKLSTGLASCMICATTLLSVATPVFAASDTQDLNVNKIIKNRAKQAQAVNAGDGEAAATAGQASTPSKHTLRSVLRVEAGHVKTPKRFQSGSSEWGKLNLSDWQMSQDTNGNMELTDYAGDKSHIVIPNSEDLIKAGKLSEGKKVVLKAQTMQKIVRDDQPESIAISDTVGGKLTAIPEDNTAAGDDWNMAFTDHHDSEDVTDDTRTPHQIKDLDKFNPNLKRMDLSNLDLSQVHTINGMLAGAENCETFGDLSKWDTSNITDMGFLFANDPKVETLGYLSGWKTNKNTNFNSIFEDDTNITNLSNLSDWDVSNGTNFAYLFANMCSLSNLGDLSKWNMGNATRINDMFQEDRALQSVGDLSNWNTHNVTNMVGLFNNATNLVNVGNLDNWDVSHVTDAHGLFAGAASLANVGKLDQWNVSNIKDANGMFHGALKLTSVGDLSKWNTSNMEDMHEMFNLTGIKQLNISNWDFSKLKDPDNLNGTLDGRNEHIYDGSFLGNNPAQVILANNLKGVPEGIKATAFNSQLGKQVVLTDNPTLLKLNDRTLPNQLQLQVKNGDRVDLLSKPNSQTFYQSNGQGFDHAGANVYNSLKSELSFEAGHLSTKDLPIDHFEPDATTKQAIDSNNAIAVANGTYNAVPKAPATAGAQVIFQDNETKQPVGDPINETGNVGDKIDTSETKAPIPNGYHLVGDRQTDKVFGTDTKVIIPVEKNDVPADIIFVDQETKKPVGDTIHKTGKPGTTIDTSKVDPPKGYTIVSRPTDKKFGTDTQVEIPVKRADADAKIVFIDSSTKKPVGDPVNETGKVGDPINTETVPVPEGYMIDGKRPTGKIFGTDKEVDIPVKKADATAQVIFVDPDKKPVGDPINKKGKIGEEINTNDPVPSGYELNGPRPTGKKFGTDSVVYIPVKKKTADAKIIFVDPDGKHVGDPINKTGNIGDKIDANVPIPDGYELNGKIPTDKVFGTDKEVDIPVKKTAPDTAGAQIIFVDPNNKQVGDPINKTGKVGDTIDTNVKIPDGYELDGQIPTNKKFGTDKIIYIHVKKLAPKTASAQIIFVDPDGKHVGNPVDKTGKIGDKIDANVPLPNGYELDGKIPTDKVFGTDKVVYVHVKKPIANDRATIRFVDEKGNQVGKSIEKIGKDGSTINMSDVAVPSGYELVDKIPTDKVFGKDKLITIHVKKPEPAKVDTTPAAKPVKPAQPAKRETPPSVAEPEGTDVKVPAAKKSAKAPVNPAPAKARPAKARPASQARLPQTGDSKSAMQKAGASLIAFFATIGTFLGYGIKTNKDNPENNSKDK